MNYQKIADTIGVDVATIRAVAEVESRGDGFLRDGRPKILFEAHKFYKYAKQNGHNADELAIKYPDICSKRWNKKLYKGGTREYNRLEKARRIDENAALMSASWGEFQIMGFNHLAAGFDEVNDFVEAQDTEQGQVQSFINFIKYNHMDKYLRAKNWAKFARAYNGAGYEANEYDEKLADAYERYSKE